MRLRPFVKQDAQAILGWIRDETAFRKWSADRYDRYPIGPEDICAQYASSGDADTFFPVTAVEGSDVVGHMIMRFPGEDRKELRFGFVIVDDRKRGMGYGKQMLTLAIQYAFARFPIQKITLGVFENNPSAYYCYKAVGFRDVPTEPKEYYHVMGQDWKCLELELQRSALTCRRLTEAEKRQICAWKYDGEYAVYDLPAYEEMRERQTGFCNPEREANYRAWYQAGCLVGFTNLLEEERSVFVGIGVAPEFCGKGYGQRILKEAHALSKQLFPDKPLYLEVRTWNTRAVRCYQKAGFQIDGAPFEQVIGMGPGTFYRMVRT